MATGRFRRFARALGACALLALGVLLAALGVVAIDSRTDPSRTRQEREAADSADNIVTDITGLYRIPVQGILVPLSIDEIIAAVRTHEHISIGGGRNSMGGQTASPRAVQLDMRQFNQVLAFSPERKEITVQAGATWYDLQRHIDPYGLAVKIMQTYSNFSVGGSLSVNAHGRYVGEGPVIGSVRSFRIVLADGSLIEASPTQNSEIFYGAIGGYGGLGVITDVTLALDDNINVERSRVKIPITDYRQYYFDHIQPDWRAVFHNGDIYPPDYDSVSAVTWRRTDKATTSADRLISRRDHYWKQRVAWVVISEWPLGSQIREHLLEPGFYTSPRVHTRNFEASYDILELEPEGRTDSTYVLQEYFVPVEHFDEWIPRMKRVFTDHRVNVLNVSIRHAEADPGSVLAWSPTESFAFVVYYKQDTDEAALREVAAWTREMIDEVLDVGGTYYLPYQPWASDAQIRRAYPRLDEFFDLKRRYDPKDKFTNNLWDRYYLSAEQ